MGTAGTTLRPSSTLCARRHFPRSSCPNCPPPFIQPNVSCREKQHAAAGLMKAKKSKKLLFYATLGVGALTGYPICRSDRYDPATVSEARRHYPRSPLRFARLCVNSLNGATLIPLLHRGFQLHKLKPKNILHKTKHFSLLSNRELCTLLLSGVSRSTTAAGGRIEFRRRSAVGFAELPR